MCIVDECSGDGPEVSAETTPIARKPHICGECRREIEPGERYRRVFMVCDGDASTYRSCRHCMVAQEWLSANCGGYVFTAVAEDIHEHIGEYPALAEGLQFLLNGMRGRWRDEAGRVALHLPVLPPSIASVIKEPVHA
jgi:hypothetical protein